MTQFSCLPMRSQHPMAQRRGISLVITGVAILVLVSMVAIGTDLGYLYMARGQLQAAADAGSLAGAAHMLDGQLFRGTPENPNDEVGQAAAREAAVAFAQSNRVESTFPLVDSNTSNDSSGDVVLGYLANPTDPNCPFDTANPALYNAVQVTVRRTAERNGVVDSFFAKAWGNAGSPIVAKATAVMSPSVVGFRVTDETGNADLLPFTVHIDAWNAVLAGVGADDFEYNPDDGLVYGGPDGIKELIMYPLTNLTSGNFGTVDIGSSNNSTADIERQILYGVNAEDLSYFGGELKLSQMGTLILNGDTGISAAVKDELDTIKGRSRVLPLYLTVSGPGNNAQYTIVGFAGIRVMKVKLTGNPKYVIIQPAIHVDASALLGNGPHLSNYVYSFARLVR